MISNDEVELKLDATHDAAAAIEASALLSGVASRRRHLHAIYFDTPGLALRNAGLSLRIRHDGERYIQTLKVAGVPAVGLFARKEWEREVAASTLVIDDALPLHAWLGDFDDAAVGPLFEVEVDRTTYDIDHDGAAIELAVDCGSVNAAGLSRPFCEMELELKDGPPAALFAFARRMDAIAPLRCGVLTKAGRGYRLVRQVDGKAAKAGAVKVTADMTAGEGFQAIVNACIRQFRLNETLFLAERDPTALHQARVAIRRLRSGFSIFRDMFDGDDRGQELADNLRRLGNALGPARALDVLLDGWCADAARPALLNARDMAYDRAAAALDSPRARGLMIDLAEWIATGAASSSPIAAAPLAPLAVDALDRFRRRIKRAGRLDELGDDGRHHVRIAAKKLRYASEYFGAIFAKKKAGRRHERFLVALEMLQDRLGQLNDMVTAPELLRQIGVDDPDEAVRIDPQQRADLVGEAAAARDDLLGCKRFWC